MKLENIDKGNSFDWGKTSRDYAKYRDIYPEEFYKAIVDFGLGIAGQNCLDIGTGTGVIPRNMYKYGALIYGGDDVASEKWNSRGWNTRQGIRYNLILLCKELVQEM